MMNVLQLAGKRPDVDGDKIQRVRGADARRDSWARCVTDHHHFNEYSKHRHRNRNEIAAAANLDGGEKATEGVPKVSKTDEFCTKERGIVYQKRGSVH